MLTNAGQPIAVRAGSLFPRLRLVVSDGGAVAAIRVPFQGLANGLPTLPNGHQRIRGTADSSATAIHNVGVNHGRTDILVRQEFLDRPKIVAVL